MLWIPRRFLLFAFIAALLVPSVSMAAYESFNYRVTNTTKNGAMVYVYHRFGPAFHLTEVASGWVDPGKKISLKLPKTDTTYELKAVFKKTDQGSATVGTAEIKWWLSASSSDQLAYENGRFVWKP
jgi:hypothetical protein